MVCRNCNYDNPEGSAFCQVCGQPLSAETPVVQQNAAGPKPLPFGLDKKKIIGIVAALAAVIVLIIIISAIASSGSEFIKAEAVINAQYNSEDDETVFTYNSTVLKDKVEGSVSMSAVSADGTHLLCFFEEESDEESDGTTLYTLYHVTKSGAKKIAESVRTGSISIDGKRGCYIDEDGVLYSCELGNGKSTKVAEDVTGSPVMSPDGKTVLYRVTEESDKDEEEDEDEDESEAATETTIKLYAWKNGKEYSLGKNYSGVGVSDNGKYVYIANSKEGKRSLYVTKLGSDDKVKLEGDYSSVTFNYDRTEALFTSDGKLYISVKGREPVKIGSIGLPTPLPASGYTRLVKTFIKVPVFYQNSDGNIVIGFIQKAGKEYEFKRLASNVASFAPGYPVPICENVDDKTIYFLKSYTKGGGDLCKVAVKADAESEELAEDIVLFEMSKSGKTVYALDDDDTLWKISGKKKDRVSDDVHTFNAFNDGVLYITEYDSKDYSGELYYSSNGKNKKKIAEEVTGMLTFIDFSVVSYTNTDGEVYISGKSVKFDKIF